MKIKVEEAQRICEKYGRDEVPILMLGDVYLRSNANVLQLTQGMQYDPSQYDLFLSSGVKEIDVVYNERLCAKLIHTYPGVYRQPVGRKSMIELDRLIDELESANAVSKRKRYVVALNEIYKKNSSGVQEAVVEYGERLHFKRWNDIKFVLNRNTILDYRIDEGGILIFFLLSSSDPQYAQKFMRYTDLVSMIVESKNAGVDIAPDFNPETDVHTVTDRLKLLEVYNDTRASLIIVGEELNEEYKTALAQVKSFDRYVRLMLIKNPEGQQKMEILAKIKAVYGQKLWQE